MSDISFSPEFWNGIAEVMVAMYFSPAAFLPGFYIAYLLLTEKIHPLFRLLFSITVGAGSIIGIWFVLGKNTGLVAGLPGQGRIYLCLLALYISYLLIAGKKLRPFYALLVSSIVGINSIFFLGIVLLYLFDKLFSNFVQAGSPDVSNTAVPQTTFPPYIFYIIGLEALIIAVHFFLFRKRLTIHFFFSRPRIKERKGK